MPTYRVKEGRTAFLNNALRQGGYEFFRQTGYQVKPDYLELVEPAKATVKKEAARPTRKGDVTFVDTDLAQTPTVQL